MTKKQVFRREGFLKQTTKISYPTHMLFYDTETYIIEDSEGNVEFPFRLGTAIYIELDDNIKVVRRHVHKFKSSWEFIEIINQYNYSKQTLYIFAHNTGFDIRVLDLPKLFNDLEYTSEPPIINDRAFIWDIKTDKGKLMFLDTANYGVISVAGLGDDLDFPKLEVDLKTNDEDLLFEYNIRDTEIIEKFMINYIKFIHDNDLGTFKITLASQSLSTYRHRFMINKPYIHINEKALQLERKAYHGGRVECYKIGDFSGETFYNLDVNSMYPYAMMSERLPTKLKGYDKGCPLEYLPIRIHRSYIILDCLLNTDIPAYSIVQNGKLIFPVGEFRTQLHDIELKFALEHNHIKKVYNCAVYEYSPLFSEYVDFFYKAKQEYSRTNNKSYRYMTKLFLNSLYGKFGQTNPIREILGETPFDGIFRNTIINMTTKEHYQEVCWFGKILKEYREGETSFSCPAVAGAITAIARMKLFEYRMIAGFDNVYYCDTDSLIVNQAGYDNLKDYCDKDKLGMLKLENSSNHLRIYNCKDYEFGDEIKIKGISKKAELLEDSLWKVLQFQGFLAWMNNGGIGGSKAHYMKKRRISKYNKGDISNLPNVSPFTMQYINDVNIIASELGVAE